MSAASGTVASPAETRRGKPRLSTYRVALDGPAKVTPGVAFGMVATVRSNRAVGDVRVTLRLPKGATLDVGSRRQTATVSPGSPGVVKYNCTVPDDGYYRFTVLAARERETAVDSYSVGEKPKQTKPKTYQREGRTRDGQRVME